MCPDVTTVAQWIFDYRSRLSLLSAKLQRVRCFALRRIVISRARSPTLESDWLHDSGSEWDRMIWHSSDGFACLPIFLPSVERTNALQSSMGIDCCWILLFFVYVSDERWIKPVTSPQINWYRLISKREDLWPTRLLLYPFASFYLSKSSMREDSINTEIHVCTSQEMLLYSN